MENEAIWQAFARSGDPLYYLLYKAVSGANEPDEDNKGVGDIPRPTD